MIVAPWRARPHKSLADFWRVLLSTYNFLEISFFLEICFIASALHCLLQLFSEHRRVFIFAEKVGRNYRKPAVIRRRPAAASTNHTAKIALSTKTSSASLRLIAQKYSRARTAQQNETRNLRCGTRASRNKRKIGIRKKIPSHGRNVHHFLLFSFHFFNIYEMIPP